MKKINLNMGLLVGFLSGVTLGLCLKVAEALFEVKVYTLLLNIDFIPYLNLYQFHESIEFLFHIIISCIIGILYVFICNWYKIHQKMKLYIIALAITFPTIFLYFPLTLLANKPTPAVNDLFAISLWIFGHIIYAISLSFFYIIFTQKQRTPS